MRDLYVVVWMQVKEEESSAQQEYNTTAEERSSSRINGLGSGETAAG